MSFGNSFFGTPRTVLRDLEVDGTTIVVDETNDRVGIGDAAPGTTLQLKGTAPYVTLQNSTSENSDGGCESKLIFEDHANAALGQIEVSHSGSSDDTKGKLILSTHTGSALTAALTINESQQATFAGDVVVGGTTPTVTIGDGGEEDTMLVFDGHAADWRIGVDDSADELEIGVGTAHDTTAAIVINASAQVTGLKLAGGTVAQAADHIMFFDGGSTGQPKVESIDDFLSAIAGSGISVSSSQLTSSGATSNSADLILHMQVFA